MARILLISHEPQAAPALIGEILREQGHDTHLHVVLADPLHPDTDFPDPHGFDAVIAFGSFANAYDAKVQSWVEPERQLISGMVEDDIPYLGVCFGGQLLAQAVGGSVERAPADEQEIGLVTFDEDAGLPVPAGPWFTWHEDRVVVPQGIEVLAHNGKAVQLFRTGRAVGTQFHPEADVHVVGSWVSIGPDHIPTHTSGPEILEAMTTNADELRRNCEQLVNWFLLEVAEVSA